MRERWLSIKHLISLPSTRLHVAFSNYILRRSCKQHRQVSLRKYASESRLLHANFSNVNNPSVGFCFAGSEPALARRTTSHRCNIHNISEFIAPEETLKEVYPNMGLVAVDQQRGRRVANRAVLTACHLTALGIFKKFARKSETVLL